MAFDAEISRTSPVSIFCCPLAVENKQELMEKTWKNSGSKFRTHQDTFYRFHNLIVLGHMVSPLLESAPGSVIGTSGRLLERSSTTKITCYKSYPNMPPLDFVARTESLFFLKTCSLFHEFQSKLCFQWVSFKIFGNNLLLKLPAFPMVCRPKDRAFTWRHRVSAICLRRLFPTTQQARNFPGKFNGFHKFLFSLWKDHIWIV